MDDRFNTAAGWVLFAGIIALGLSSISSRVFHAERPEKLGYPVEVAESAAGGGEMSIEEALSLASVEAGEAVFAKCAACHTVNQGGADGIGPNLWGIMGKPIGNHAPGFAYSSALAEKGGTWDWANMSEWLKNPRGFANGTKMSFAGLSSAEDRAAISLYLNANGSNLPVPAYTAPEPAAVEEGLDGAGEGPGAVSGAPVDAVEAAGAMGAEQPVAGAGTTAPVE